MNEIIYDYVKNNSIFIESICSRVRYNVCHANNVITIGVIGK